jgi:drug/metabolite transporter (DMT)-like permease
MLGEALSLVSALLWAATTISSAKALQNLNPLSANVLRTLFAAISMLPVAFAAGEIQNLSNTDPRGIFLLVIGAIIGFGVADTCLFKSITMIGTSRSYTIAYTYPFFTMALAVLFLQESFSIRYLIGTVAIFVGITNVVYTLGNEGKRKSLEGFVASLGTSILYSIATILVSLGLRSVSVILANAIRFPVLFLFLFLVSSVWKLEMHITRRDLVLLALSGILGMTVAGVTFLFGIKLIGASKAVALSSSSPVWTSLFSILFLKEKVTLRVVASSILVVVGIYFLT